MNLKGVWPRDDEPCAEGLSEREITDLQNDLILCDPRPFAEGLAHSPQEIFSENNSATNDIVQEGCRSRCQSIVWVAASKNCF